MKTDCQKSSRNGFYWFQQVRRIVCAGVVFSACVGLAACATSNVATPPAAMDAAGNIRSADSAAFQDTFRSFTACDAGFFGSLHDHADAWAKVAPLDTRGDISWIKVANRNAKDGQNTAFTTPPVIAGLKFLSYFDEFDDLDSLGLYYYWGFLVEGNVDEVAQKLQRLIHDSEDFRKDGNSFVRTETAIGNSPWTPKRTSSGSAPGLLKMERVFIIEPEQKGITRVSCTLQGGINNAVLKDIRPDIDPKDYPAQLSLTLFDDTPIPASVMESIDAARAGKPLWTPKFKKIRYTVKYHKPDAQDLEGTVEAIVQPNGLIRSEVNANATVMSTNLQQLTFDGLFTLKARINGMSEGRVTIVNELDFGWYDPFHVKQLPAELKPGITFSGLAKEKEYPPKAGDKTFSTIITCKVKERLDANTLFPSLTGKAIKMECAFITSENPMNYTYFTAMYIEDLGFFINIGTPWADDSTTIASMEIER